MQFFFSDFQIQNSVEITFLNFSTHFLYIKIIQLDFGFKNPQKKSDFGFGFGFLGFLGFFWVRTSVK
jgi:hypothetical protein